ncbi:heterokaryon incompatibility protein-domain-containing protein, partial [Xylogone sp. PMI_703]
IICKDPDISVDGNNPCCKTCNSSCPWQELVSKQLTINSPASFAPTNEPAGRLNLWWPSSVPYTRSYGPIQDNAPSSPAPTSEQSIKEGHSFLPDMIDPSEKEQQFRLALLSPATDKDSLVHLCLETCFQANCLEYETVSYTWGGEDGDYALSQPVFIGPYWDLLFQTQNCWEMLRLFRLQKGTRTLWIDALCINQQDIRERSEQVARMRHIYEQCSRVLVYLGPDLALPAVGQFPIRHRLHELDKVTINTLQHSPPNLEKLLIRNYFSRVWIIQELILSQRAIIRIGDIDFWADALMPLRLAPWSDWDSTAAPWAKYIAQQTIPVKDVFEIMRLTSTSQASDLRDRLFGTIGLLWDKADTLEKDGLFVDYRLSVQHMFIGFFSYCIIKLNLPYLLIKAAGVSAQASSPSWVPNWASSQESWQRIFTKPDFDPQQAANFIQNEVLNNSNSVYLNYLTPTAYPEGISWNHKITVDKDTGALSPYLTRFCTIPTRPVLIGEFGNLHIFKMRESDVSLYLVTEDSFESVCPGCEDIFILDPQSSDLIYLILRLQPDQSSKRTYKVVATCIHIFWEGSYKYNMGLQRFRRSVLDEIDYLDKIIGDVESGRNLSPVLSFFPGATSSESLFTMYRNVLSQLNTSSSEFEATYLSSIDARFHPKIDSGFLILTFKENDWDIERKKHDRDHDYYGYAKEHFGFPPKDSGSFQSDWEWRATKRDEWRPAHNVLRYYSNHPRPSVNMFSRKIYLRVSMRSVRGIRNILYPPLTRIQCALQCNFDELVHFLHIPKFTYEYELEGVTRSVKPEFAKYD